MRTAKQAGLTMCNRSITLLPCSALKHSLSSPLGSTDWQMPQFVVWWSLESSGLNEVFLATWNRWATAYPSFASMSERDGVFTSHSVADNL